MGSPRKESFGQKELKSPSVAEKIRLLEIGKETGRSLNLERLSEVLEEVKGILLPLVPWLDKPLLLGRQFKGCSVPTLFQKKRAIQLFEANFLYIWLERSGKWLLWIRGAGEGRFFRDANSRQLAEIILQKSDGVLKEFLRNQNFLKELVFLKEIALYDAVFLRVLSQFFKAAMALVEEREKRFRIMRERLSLLDDFTQSLDPLISQGKTVVIKEYSIWRDHERGTVRYTGGYLSPEALGSFWEVIKSRSELADYRESVDEYRPRSLEDFFWRVSYIFEEITKARSDGHADAKSLFGFSSGRLPFTEKELMIMEDIAGSLTT